MIKPKRLKTGSTVAIVSPSSGAAARAPHVLERGLNELRSLGLQIREMPNTRADSETLYHNPRIRAEDINAAFADPEIDAVFASIGGDDSVRILPYLDIDLIMAHPKPIMGIKTRPFRVKAIFVAANSAVPKRPTIKTKNANPNISKK